MIIFQSSLKVKLLSNEVIKSILNEKVEVSKVKSLTILTDFEKIISI